MPPTLSMPPSPHLLTDDLNLNITDQGTLHFHTNTPDFVRMHASDEYTGTVCSVIALVCIMSFVLYRTIAGNVPQFRVSVLWPRYVHPKRALRRVVRRVMWRASSVSTAQECDERDLEQSGGSGVQEDVELVVWDSHDTTLQGSVNRNVDKVKSSTVFEDGRLHDENGFVWVDL